METDKQYKVGVDARSALNGNLSWDTYIGAEEFKNNMANGLGMDLKVYKVVTTVTEADRVSEDYWEYR